MKALCLRYTKVQRFFFKKIPEKFYVKKKDFYLFVRLNFLVFYSSHWHDFISHWKSVFNKLKGWFFFIHFIPLKNIKETNSIAKFAFLKKKHMIRKLNAMFRLQGWKRVVRDLSHFDSTGKMDCVWSHCNITCLRLGLRNHN